MCVSYGLVCTVDPGEEERFGDKEGDAEVLVDSVPVALETTEETEGEDADEQTDQRQQDPHPRYDVQQQLMLLLCFLRSRESGRREEC